MSTYFAAPTTQGTGDGLSEANAFLISDFLSLPPEPGDTLILLDGTYTGANSMLDILNLSGTQAGRITIKAKNDAQPWLDGQEARRPFRLRGCNWLVMEGFHCSNSNQQVVHLLEDSNNNIIRRVCAWDAGTQGNGNYTVMQTGKSANNLFEDIATFGRGRKKFVFGLSQSNNNTVRRIWSEWNLASNNGGNSGVSGFYGSYNNIVENAIATWDEDAPPEGPVQGPLSFDHMSNVTDKVSNSKYLGCIAYLKTNQNISPITTSGMIRTGVEDYDGVEFRDIVAYSEQVAMRTAAMRSPSGMTPTDLKVNNITEAGAGAADAFINSPWVVTNSVRDTNLANVPNIFNGAGTEGARVCKRYVDGVLTDEPLWPWPMDASIRLALTRSGRDPDVVFGGVGFGVTEQIEALFGAIPAECRLDGDPGAGSATLDQLAFRFRNDDGSETTATWKAATDTQVSLPIGECFRLRLGIGDTAAGEELAVGLRLQINLNGGGWVNASGTTGPVRVSLNSVNYANNDNTTQQITTGTFISPNGGMRHGSLVPGTDIDFVTTENDRVEVEFGLCGIAEELSDGDKVQFRVIRESTGQPLDAYTQTPEVTFTGETVPATIVHESSTTFTDGGVNGNTVVLDKPTGAVEGDVLVAHIRKTSAAEVTAPTGWVLIASSPDPSGRTHDAFYKALGAAEPADYTFSWEGNTSMRRGGMSRFSGVDNDVVLDVAASVNNANSSTATGLSITTVTDDAFVGVAASTQLDTSQTSPTGMDLLWIVPTNNRLGLHGSMQAAAGASGNKDITLGASMPWSTIMWALRPSVVTITAALSGTATADIVESDVKTGGKTVIWTLTNDTWVTGAAFDDNKLGLATNLLSDVNPASGWNNEVIPAIAAGDIVRTSDTVVTLTLPAVANYDIDLIETIQSTVPANLLTTSTGNIVASPTFTVSLDPATFADVVTEVATNITVDSAQLNGDLISEGGSTVTRLGFVYDTVSRADPGDVSPETSAYASVTDVDGASFPEDFYSKVVSGLASGTQYFFRIFAQNTSGFAYGSELDFTTLSGFGKLLGRLRNKLVRKGKN